MHKIRAASSHRKDVLFLVGQDGVDFFDVLVGLALNFLFRVLQFILGDLAVFLQLLGKVVRVTPFIADRNAAVLGHFLADLVEFASTFLIDFDRIDKMIAANADAQYDWYGAFGLLVSMVWLYLEILNVLGKARGGGIRR